MLTFNTPLLVDVGGHFYKPNYINDFTVPFLWQPVIFLEALNDP